MLMRWPKVNIGSNRGMLIVSIAAMSTLLQAMAALWRGVHPALEKPENDKARAKLAKLLGVEEAMKHLSRVRRCRGRRWRCLSSGRDTAPGTGPAGADAG